MRQALILYFGVIFYFLACLAGKGQASIPSGWTNTSILVPNDERAHVAKAALDVLVERINSTTGMPDDLDTDQSATFLSTLADYDYYSGGSEFKTTVLNSLIASSLRNQVAQGSANNDASRWGLALYKIYRAYPDQSSLLENAKALWNKVHGSFIDDASAQAGTLLSANITFNSSCDNKPVNGAVLFFSSGNTVSNGETMGPFIALSSYLFNATSNTTYSSAANTAIQFAKNFLSDGTSVFDSYDIKSCKLTNWIWTYNAGYFIEGLSVYANVTGDKSSQSYLDTLVQRSIVQAKWTGANGVITEDQVTTSNMANPSKLGPDWKAIFIVGLFAYLENGGFASANSPLVQQYVAIQYNAVYGTVNSTINGEPTYSPGWVGPRIGYYFAPGQLAASELFSVGLTLPSNATDAQTTNSNPEPSDPTSHKSNTGAVVGGVIGGLAALAALIGLLAWYLQKRRHASRYNEGHTNPILEPDDTLVQPFTLTTSSPSAVEPPAVRRMPYAIATRAGKLDRERYLYSDSGGPSSTSVPASSSGLDDIHVQGETGSRMITVDSEMLQQVLAGVTGVLERIDARAEEGAQPPAYSDWRRR